MSRPEISVIIPYYNAVRHIERAARSLFGQSLGRRLETVWVDDGSTDGSAALLHSILSEEGADAPLYTTLTHDHNRGSAAARLTGLSAASGRYIIFCDADDYADNDAYETMLHTACTTGADMVVCDYIVERGDSRVRHTGMRDSRSLTSDMLRGKVHAGLWNKLIARHLFDSIGPLWIEGIDMWEDAWVTTRAAYHAQKTAYLPQPLYHYVSNPQSYTGRFSDKSISDMLAVTEVLNLHPPPLRTPLSEKVATPSTDRTFRQHEQSAQRYSKLSKSNISPTHTTGYTATSFSDRHQSSPTVPRRHMHASEKPKAYAIWSTTTPVLLQYTTAWEYSAPTSSETTRVH